MFSYWENIKRWTIYYVSCVVWLAKDRKCILTRVSLALLSDWNVLPVYSGLISLAHVRKRARRQPTRLNLLSRWITWIQKSSPWLKRQNLLKLTLLVHLQPKNLKHFRFLNFNEQKNFYKTKNALHHCMEIAFQSCLVKTLINKNYIKCLRCWEAWRSSCASSLNANIIAKSYAYTTTTTINNKTKSPIHCSCDSPPSRVVGRDKKAAIARAIHFMHEQLPLAFDVCVHFFFTQPTTMHWSPFPVRALVSMKTGRWQINS